MIKTLQAPRGGDGWISVVLERGTKDVCLAYLPVLDYLAIVVRRRCSMERPVHHLPKLVNPVEA